MTRAPQLYLVSYDIRDARRLRRVYSAMRGFGDHIQYSVFRCVLSETQLARLESRLREELDIREDQVLVVRLGPAGPSQDRRLRTLGQPLLHPERVVRIL